MRWLGALLLTLAGLFGMHGLAGHGTEEGAAAHAAMSSMASGLATSAGHVAHSVEVTGSAVVAGLPRADPASGTGMDMSGTGMCLAVLLLGLVALLLRLARSRLRPAVVLTARPVRAPVRRGRAPRPPDLYDLSIQRC